MAGFGKPAIELADKEQRHNSYTVLHIIHHFVEKINT